MREIKFRAWYVPFKKMVQPNQFKGKYNQQLDNYILMQFTGLKDKNGKEIYEGDIVGIASPVAIIEYNHCGFVFKWIDKHYITNRKQLEPIFTNINLFSVFGNIHENPELSCT